LHDLAGPDPVFGALVGLLALAGVLVAPVLRRAWAALGAAAATIAVLGAGLGPGVLFLGALLAIGSGFFPERGLALAGAGAGAAITLSAASPEVDLGPLALLALVALVAGVLASDLERRRGAPLVAVLTAASGVGMFLTAPDTDGLIVVLAAVLPIVLGVVLRPTAPEPSPRWAPLPGGAVALLAVLVWALVEGGRPRPGSVVGGVVALGVLVLEPVVHRMAGRQPGDPPAAALVVLQAVLVIVAARVVGFRESALVAAVLAVPLVAGAVVALLAARRLAPEGSS
jgi:hypothetical protein